ncbi:MAG: hypothetical protein ABL894_08875 [Hyphomicrobium sp.]
MPSLEGPDEGMPFAAGQRWTYRAAPGLDGTRLVIGAIVTFQGGRIFCCSITHAGSPLPDGRIGRVNIPFLPLTEAALVSTVLTLDGTGELCASFASKLQEWSEDPRGMSTFTVPFDGYLDHLISLQVARLSNRQAA